MAGTNSLYVNYTLTSPLVALKLGCCRDRTIDQEYIVEFSKDQSMVTQIVVVFLILYVVLVCVVSELNVVW